MRTALPGSPKVLHDRRVIGARSRVERAGGRGGEGEHLRVLEPELERAVAARREARDAAPDGAVYGSETTVNVRHQLFEEVTDSNLSFEPPAPSVYQPFSPSGVTTMRRCAAAYLLEVRVLYPRDRGGRPAHPGGTGLDSACASKRWSP